MPLLAHLYRTVMRPVRTVGVAILAAIAPFLVLLVADKSPSTYADTIVPAGITFAIAVLILTAAVLRDERDGGTLPFIYLRPIPRWRFAIEAMGAGMAAALTIAVITWLLTVVAALISGISFNDTLPGLVLYAVAAIGYTAIFLPLGYMVPRALLIGLVYITIFEWVMTDAVPAIAQISIWRISASVFADFGPSISSEILNRFISPVTIGAWGGVAKIAGVVVVGWALLTWALSKRDAV